MRLGRIAVGIATLTAALALGVPAPAQAQEDESCFKNTDTPLDGMCIPVTGDDYGNVCIGSAGVCVPTTTESDDPCIRQYCVTGLMENVNAALELVNDTLPGIDDVLPVCTPNLLSGPICVG